MDRWSRPEGFKDTTATGRLVFMAETGGGGCRALVTSLGSLLVLLVWSCLASVRLSLNGDWLCSGRPRCPVHGRIWQGTWCELGGQHWPARTAGTNGTNGIDQFAGETGGAGAASQVGHRRTMYRQGQGSRPPARFFFAGQTTLVSTARTVSAFIQTLPKIVPCSQQFCFVFAVVSRELCTIIHRVSEIPTFVPV